MYCECINIDLVNSPLRWYFSCTACLDLWISSHAACCEMKFSAYQILKFHCANILSNTKIYVHIHFGCMKKYQNHFKLDVTRTVLKFYIFLLIKPIRTTIIIYPRQWYSLKRSFTLILLNRGFKQSNRPYIWTPNKIDCLLLKVAKRMRTVGPLVANWLVSIRSSLLLMINWMYSYTRGEAGCQVRKNKNIMKGTV